MRERLAALLNAAGRLLHAEMVAAWEGKPGPTRATLRGWVEALAVDLPPVTAADVCGEAPAQCEADDDPTDAEFAAMPLRLRLALACGKPRCAGCGCVVHTVTTGYVDDGGATRVTAVEVACVEGRCDRLTAAVRFAEPVGLEDGAMVARMRQVVLGDAS